MEEVKVFFNTMFKKRDYESKQAVYCKAEAAPNAKWANVTLGEMLKKFPDATLLQITDDVEYFGYL